MTIVLEATIVVILLAAKSGLVVKVVEYALMIGPVVEPMVMTQW